MSELIDPMQFRQACGQFATGVTVVTALDPERGPVGLTANSFTSVSLDPPLVLVSVAKTAGTHRAFAEGPGFVVHVLGADAKELAQRFATRDIDRFEGLEWTPGTLGLPLLSGALARFECAREHAYEGGDHTIFLGRVVGMELAGDTERPALGFFRGGYRVID